MKAEYNEKMLPDSRAYEHYSYHILESGWAVALVIAPRFLGESKVQAQILQKLSGIYPIPVHCDLFLGAPTSATHIP